MNSFKKFCFIPAKSASTRLRKKNILKLKGKELIGYPIDNAKDSKLFEPNDIILSTEAEEIRKIAQSFGANVPYLRDPVLAKDPYGVKDVVLDFLVRFSEYKSYDHLCILLPTAPLCAMVDLINSYEIFLKQGSGVVMSVTVTEHSALRSVYIRSDEVVPLFNEFINKKSQELEATYRINGAVIWINVSEFIAQKSYFIKPWGAYAMPPERSVDIDDEIGFKFAKLLLENE